LVNTGVIDGKSRSFVLYIPRDLRPGAPLLFMFHGGGGDGPMAREGTGHEFDLLADRNGFIVAYPDGIDRSWTGCRQVQNRVADRRNIDDVKFVDAIIAQEVARHGIDPKRVFATGHSMGAALSYRLALERPKAIAAIAAISSNLPAPDNMDCKPANVGIPVMIINGTADPVSPYNGGSNSRGTGRGRTLSTDATVQYFVGLNGLSGPPTVERLPHQKPSDRTWVERLTWSAPEKPPVILYTVHGGGHVVPQPYYRYPSSVGAMTEDLDAPAVIWDFFSKVPAR
jgi:polyhydroxybutyrate depolymerase